jgi:phospholipase/lecithinase/hemolysin
MLSILSLLAIVVPLVTSHVLPPHIKRVLTTFAYANLQIVAFGDSLTDNGSGDGQFFGELFPSPPYFDFRFSNGLVWVEYIPAKDLQDYAYGGAVVNNSASNGGPPSVMAQVNDYLIGHHFDVSEIADETQYFFWGGANDILDMALDTPEQLPTLEVTLPLFTGFLVKKLVQAGAKNILVIGIPSWVNAPIAKAAVSATVLNDLGELNTVINEIIQSNVTTAATQDGLNLKFFDTDAFTNTILCDPAKFGFTNIVDPCLTNFDSFINGNENNAVPIVCPNPDEFLFWDGEHPTTRAHSIYAKEIMSFLNWPHFGKI